MVGIAIIGPQIVEAIRNEIMSDLSEMIMVVGLIASVAGFDVLTKTVFKTAN